MTSTIGLTVEEENFPEQYELMDQYTSDDKLASAVLAVSDRAWRRGYIEGHKTCQAQNTLAWCMVTACFFICGLVVGDFFF